MPDTQHDDLNPSSRSRTNDVTLFSLHTRRPRHPRRRPRWTPTASVLWMREFFLLFSLSCLDLSLFLYLFTFNLLFSLDPYSINIRLGTRGPDLIFIDAAVDSGAPAGKVVGQTLTLHCFCSRRNPNPRSVSLSCCH